MLNYVKNTTIDWPPRIITRLTRLTNTNRAKGVNVESEKVVDVGVGG